MADSYSLLDLILELLRDDKEAERFLDDPDGYLKAKGLEGVCSEDVRDAAPLILDYAPVTLKGSFDRTYDTGNHGSAYGGDISPNAGGGQYAPPPRHRDDDGEDKNDGEDKGDERDAVIKEITNILNTYNYTAVDDRDTLLDQSVNQLIFAKGDVEQEFDYDTTIASGDGAVAAGESVYGAATGDGAIAAGGDINGDAVSGDGNVTGNNNTLVDGDKNIVGDENEVGNTEVEIDDSFNDASDDDGVDDSFNGNDLSDDDGTDDSYNGNDLSTNVTDSLNDNEIGNTETEVDVDVEDVAVAVDDAVAAVVEDNEVAL